MSPLPTFETTVTLAAPSRPAVDLTRVQYLLERVNVVTHAIEAAVVLPIVTGYVKAERFPIGVEFTLGDEPIRDLAGALIGDQAPGVGNLHRGAHITITGRTGTHEQLGSDASGNTLFADGPALFDELRKFLAQYLRDAAAQQVARAQGRPDGITGALALGGVRLPAAPQGDTRLVFRALGEGDEYYVEPLSLTPPRDAASSRFSWTYTIELIAYRRAGPHPRTGVGGFLDTLRDASRTAARCVAKATAVIAQATVTVDDAHDAFREIVAGPARSVGRLFTQLDQLTRSADAFANLPAEWLGAVSASLEQAVNWAADTVAMLPFADRADARASASDLVTRVEDLRREVDALCGRRGVPRAATATPMELAAVGAIGAGLAADDAPVPTRPYVVRPGQTVASIAAQVVGNADAAQAIAALNGMASWDTLGDGAPLEPGTVLLLPASSANAAHASSAALAPAAADNAYGVGWLLGSDNDLVVPGITPRAATLTRGPALLARDLRVRLTMRQGECRALPFVGTLPFLGDTVTAERTGRIASSVREQLLADARIAKVEAIDVADGGDRIGLRAVARAKSGPRLAITTTHGATA